MPQQIVELNPSSTAVTPGGTFTVEVIYSSGPEGDRNSEVPGINHFLHYDSSKLNIVGITPGFEFQGDPIEPTESTEADQGAPADDGVQATDRVFATSIIDLLSSFPGSENDPGILYTIEFEATGSFDGSELVNRFVGDPPTGFDAPSADNLTLEVNLAPTVANPIADITVDEDGTITPVNLFDVFDDDVDADADLTYSVTNSNESLVTTAIDSTTGELSFTLTPDASGTADITVQAEDTSGAASTDDFTIEVTAVNDPPVVENPIADIAVEANREVAPIDLFNVFEDVEDADADLTYTASSGDTNLVTTSIDSATGELSFTLVQDASGSTDITVVAEDTGGETAEETFTITVDPNDPPGFTSPDAVDVDENLTSVVTTVTANDPEGDDPITFALVGGADSSLFAIDPNTGELTFNNAPDFENPLDANTDNIYEVQVEAEDEFGETSTQDLSITVNDVNEAPEFTSPDAVNVDENVTFVTTVTAEDPEGDAITFALVGGADSSLFAIDANTGELTFNNAPDFENPLDANTDNVYEVQVEAEDEFGETSTQDLSLTVNDVSEGPIFEQVQGNVFRAEGTDQQPAIIKHTIDNLPGSDIVEIGFVNPDVRAAQGNEAALASGTTVFSVLPETLPNGEEDGISEDDLSDLSRIINVTSDETQLEYYFIGKEGNVSFETFDDVEGGNGSFTFTEGAFSFSAVLTNEEVPTGAGLQGQPNREVIDLRGESSVTANLGLGGSVTSVADFDNLVGLYRVDSEDGTVGGIAPGQEGYTDAVLGNAVGDFILKRDTSNIEVELEGRQILAPFIISRGGNLDAVPGGTDELPLRSEVYTPYIAGNSDGADHFRLLGDNTFGIEDLRGGGDQDFNDMIFQLEFA